MGQIGKDKRTFLDSKMKDDGDDQNSEDFLDSLSQRETQESEGESKSSRTGIWKKKLSKDKFLISDNVNRFIDQVKKPDFRGYHVYLVDTGDELGTVTAMIYDEKKDAVGLKIKDNKSGAILDVPIEQVYEEKEGVVLLPSWYINTARTIDKIEFKERISPELRSLVHDDMLSVEQLYEIFVKYDDEMASCIKEAAVLEKILNMRLKLLENQRFSLKGHLTDLTEERLMQNIDRKQFSESIMEQRRKAKIFDLNIKRCKELLQRLDRTSFSVLGKNILSVVEKNNLSSMEDYKDKTGDADIFSQDDINQKHVLRNMGIGIASEDEIIESLKKPGRNQRSSPQDTNEYNEIDKRLKIRDEYIKELLRELEKKNKELHRLKNESYKNRW